MQVPATRDATIVDKADIAAIDEYFQQLLPALATAASTDQNAELHMNGKQYGVGSCHNSYGCSSLCLLP